MKATTRLLASVAGACVAAALLGGCRKDLCYNHYREAQIATGWECVLERD